VERRYSSYSFSTSALDGGEWSASRPGRALPPGKGQPVPIVQEAGWAPEPVWTQRIEEKSFAPAGDRTPIVRSSSPKSDTILPELPGPTYHFLSTEGKSDITLLWYSTFATLLVSRLLLSDSHTCKRPSFPLFLQGTTIWYCTSTANRNVTGHCDVFVNMQGCKTKVTIQNRIQDTHSQNVQNTTEF
jgi:hypothetical protein